MAKQVNFTGTEDILDVYVTDLKHRARYTPIDFGEGEISIELLAEPTAVHVLLAVPGYGRVWCTADNSGDGYAEDAEVPLHDALAMSRIRQCERRMMSSHLEEPPDEQFEAAWDLFDLGRPLESLHQGILAGEALEHAAAMLALELRDHDVEPLPVIASPLFGERLEEYSIGVGPDWHNVSLQPNFLHSREKWDTLSNICNATTIPNFWRWVEFGRDCQRWAGIEEILSHCEEKGMEAKSFSIFWGGIGGMPPWFRELDYPDKLKAVENWTTDLVSKLKGRISCWEIANEMHDWEFANKIPQLSHEQAFEIAKLVSEITGSLDPGTPRIINHCCPWGEYGQRAGQACRGASRPQEQIWSPLSFLDEIIHQDIEFEGIGVQMYYPSRDLMDIMAHLDRFAEYGKPIWITEMGTPSSSGSDMLETDQIDMTIGWRGPWEQENQADWVELFFLMAMSRPYIRNITYWDFDDERAFIKHAGLLDRDGQPKQSYHRILELCQTFGIGGPAEWPDEEY
ncbi:MAG: endo-1,4-beta-xylanase [Planctomycetota bacterium]|jgi:GH35 family endo-1,4-beta-xylanase|nr:endo-1,4-beta-xylanase [Planctomycetota bacterium]MDP7251727.1 endo-1,4-beta-xylanase [Planctomycetota bacterium]